MGKLTRLYNNNYNKTSMNFTLQRDEVVLRDVVFPEELSF